MERLTLTLVTLDVGSKSISAKEIECAAELVNT
jgi:hypothetical protein